MGKEPASRSGASAKHAATSTQRRRPRPKFTNAQSAGFEALLRQAAAEAERRAAEYSTRLDPDEPWGSAAVRVFDVDGYGFAEWLRQHGFRTARSGIGHGARVGYGGGVDKIGIAEAWCAGFASVLDEAGVGTIVDSSLD